MNELQEFFQSVAVEKKKVSEEQARIQAREQRLQPQVKVELNDLSDFFGTLASAKRNLTPKTIVDSVTPAKPEQTKMNLELESFFSRLSNFENALEEQINLPTPKDGDKIEVVISDSRKEEKSSTQLLADAMSNFTKDSPGHMAPPIITEEKSELAKIKEEFRHFKEMVIKQMSSIGGGGEVNLLKLDDVDTGAIGNGKVLSYNASTGKLQFVTSSGGGSSNLSDLSDVDTTNLADDSIMQYNSTSGKFEFTNELDGGSV
jgi:superfamily II RNA helicase